MARRSRETDPRQLTLDALFETPPPSPATNLVGSMNFAEPVRDAINEAVAATREDGKDRFTIATEMSRLTGKEITKHMLDAWTADSKEGHRFPIEFLPAFCAATNSMVLLDVTAKLCGCAVLAGREVAEANLGRLQRMKALLAKEERRLRQQLSIEESLTPQPQNRRSS